MADPTATAVRSGPMVVAALAPADLRPDIDDLTGAVRTDARRADLSAADAAALEYALRVADARSGWVLAVASGPPAAEAVLAGAAALGATAVLIAEAAHEGREPVLVGPADLAGDPAATATALADAIGRFGTPALVICGDRSPAHGVGAVPALMADALGLDQALGLVNLAVEGPDRLVAERRLDGGWRERIEITGPAVVSVEAAGVRLRRASLAAALATTGSAVTHLAPTTGPAATVQYGRPRPYRPRTRPVPPPTGDPRQRLLALTGALSTREPPRIVGPLGAPDAADEVLRFLERSGALPPSAIQP
ncbi:MAG TPA: mycofactocin-associated electron transfer flavoprotein beta subunit [Acidimicrobiales bacterium]|jgi:electron transfer flavoprotein beta subunit|nr:mycofactocin-associated electron transfer flavoprotein beta subunit [Acidimicrobiales bacterium]